MGPRISEPIQVGTCTGRFLCIPVRWRALSRDRSKRAARAATERAGGGPAADATLDRGPPRGTGRYLYIVVDRKGVSGVGLPLSRTPPGHFLVNRAAAGPI